ncbi:SWIM zinc finger family protein [Massilia sp. BJB1822]|uniref:SWIM zinc finger family protein n=1 Tax=Massilia sp. BJB1822 TaxID=2744470 RepID=UPI001592ED0E|nr:SWIM zinc finger family protein [Massilia sp. BJB1822]NVE01127.1 SWIM zinc finger family protein [Massilia sp. BJB1822]
MNWLAIYRNFDDDALAALSSAGLLRRAAKDVEAGKVEWAAPPTEQGGAIRADGQLVQADAQGPAKAHCDCSAPGICKHILSAALWLRSAPPAPGTAAATEQADASQPEHGAADDQSAPGETAQSVTAMPQANALGEVLAMAQSQVFKQAGRAATRKAADLHAAAGPASITAQGGVLLIEAPELDLVCRYIANGGFKGMVSEAPAASRAALHLLALTLVWRDAGRGISWPDATPDATDTTAGAAPEGLSQAERQFLAHVRRILLELCGIGWSHISDIMPPQLRALGTSARLESFPRLAGLLRTLAGTAELLSRRDFSADERQALRLAARIHALCHALEYAPQAALPLLRGQARRSFDDSASLELLPLGAHWWQQRSGARGLSIAFWDHAAGGIVQTVLARRDSNDPSFDRQKAWTSQALWQGSSSPALLAQGTLRLENARLSSDRRLGLGGETRASQLPIWRSDDARWRQAGFDDWQALASSLRAAAGLCGENLEYILLKPARFEAPQPDEIGQALLWTLYDRQSDALQLRLPFDASQRERIENLEAWVKSGLTLAAVLARLERTVHGAQLEPVALMIDTSGKLRSISLDYEACTVNKGWSLTAGIARMFKAREAAPPVQPAAAHLEAMARLLDLLENKGMTGRLHIIDSERAELESIQHLLLAVGLDTVARTLASYLAKPGAVQALILVHLCQTCAELDMRFLPR